MPCLNNCSCIDDMAMKIHLAWDKPFDLTLSPSSSVPISHFPLSSSSRPYTLTLKKLPRTHVHVSKSSHCCDRVNKINKFWYDKEVFHLTTTTWRNWYDVFSRSLSDTSTDTLQTTRRLLIQTTTSAHYKLLGVVFPNDCYWPEPFGWLPYLSASSGRVQEKDPVLCHSVCTGPLWNASIGSYSVNHHNKGYPGSEIVDNSDETQAITKRWAFALTKFTKI